MISNAIKYKFDDFTFNNYMDLLQLAQARYKFVGYDIDIEQENNFVIWRHDIEFSVLIACHFAEIENEKGIKSNYFLNIHSEFYNALDKQNVQRIKRSIISNGHNIGLHFDTSFYDIDDVGQLEICILKDKAILEDVFGTPISVFSFHNTNSFSMSCEDDMYGGLINVYSKKFKSVPYCSDSLGYWRFNKLYDLLNDSKITKMQVLTHDAMWSEIPKAPRQRIKDSIEKDAHASLCFYDEYLKNNGHKNIDEYSE